MMRSSRHWWMLWLTLCGLFAPLNASAQPEFFPAEPDPYPVPDLPDFNPALMLPGDKDPIPETTDQDLELTLTVTRKGMADLKQNLFGHKGRNYWERDSVTNWSYGPYKMKAHLYANGVQNLAEGRAAIVAFLGNWQDSRAHYLKVLETFRAARFGNGIHKDRQTYYAKVSAEVRRVVDVAKDAAQDVAFLKSVIERQRSFHTGTLQLGPMDERSPLTADITFAGGKADERLITSRIYMGRFEGQRTQDFKRDIAANNFSHAPGIPDLKVVEFGPGSGPAYEFMPNIAVELFDLAGCETDQLDMAVLGLNKRLKDLTPAPASQFDFTPQEREWYEKTTRAVLTRVFRETYRQGVYEAVRSAWAFSGASMPRAMQLTDKGLAKEPWQWHRAFRDPTNGTYLVDGAGLPIIRYGAPLRNPANIDGRQIRIHVPEAGGTEPLGLGVLHTYLGFTQRKITKEMDAQLRHKLVTWQPKRANSNDNALSKKSFLAGGRVRDADLMKIESFWRGHGYYHAMMEDQTVISPLWSQLRATRLFEDAPISWDPAENSYAFRRAPRMHQLDAHNWDGPLNAKLTLRYERSVSKPNSYDIDEGWQDVVIDVGLKSISGAAPLKVCPEPAFDDPPQLRVVQLWGNDGDKADDDEYRELEYIWPGHPYFVEAEFDEAPPNDIYRVRVDGGDSVRVTRTKTDSKLYRSDVITFAPEQQP